MLKEILDAAGVLYPKTRFPKLPEGTCVVPLDHVETEGADKKNFIQHHDATLELYAIKPDPEAEAAIEAQLDAHGVAWTKESRQWLESEKRYLTIYEFSYITKY